jgi:Helix-turn-helix domain
MVARAGWVFRRKLGYLIVDVDRAAELYAAGWTLRRIGEELGVDHSTVAYRLHRAGVHCVAGVHGGTTWIPNTFWICAIRA